MDSRLRIIFIVIAVGLAGYFLIFKKDAPTADITYRPADPPTAQVRGGPEERVTIRSGGLRAVVSTYSGGVVDMKLTDEPFPDPKTHEPFQLSTTRIEPAYPLRSDVVFERDGRNVLPQYLTFSIARRTDTEVELVATPPGSDVEVRRVIAAHTPYAFRVRTNVVNHGAPGRLRYAQNVYHWVKRDEEAGGFFRQSWQLSEGLCHHGDTLIREARDELNKPGKNGARNAEFVGLGNLYFLYALARDGSEPADCMLRSEDGRPDLSADPTGSLLTGQLVYAPAQLAQGENHEYRTIAYFGPKLGSALTAAAPVLHEAVNLGFFALIARGLLKLLQFLHSVARNWGVAIILLTVIVRTALFPLLARSTKSMAMMQKLKPEIDALNEKYADNQEQKGLAMMELYRKHKVNPVSGCLPQFAQLPVWWALYTTLQTSVELFHAPFFGPWRDLSAPDPVHIGPIPFPVLPLVLGLVMFLQQKMMPPAMPDPAQAKMMLYFMPIFLTAISLFLPAGLALYMLVNSVLAIIQQKITKAQIDRMVGPTGGGSGGAIDVRPALATAGDPPPRNSLSGREGGRRGGRR